MKMNLWLLARQAGAAAVLRFRPARFYAYGLPVFVLVWAAVGMVLWWSVSWSMCVRFQAAFVVNKSSLCVVIF